MTGSIQTRKYISIHALRGEGDNTAVNMMYSDYYISIHALRGEGDVLSALGAFSPLSFQSTPSVGRATSFINP